MASPCVPWVEQHRPKSLDDVAAQTEVITALRGVLRRSGDLPHMLLHGPPGTGKTSTILALCRELFGDAMPRRVKEVNASDERGIAVVRTTIKDFAQQLVSKAPSGGAPAFKIIVLDEADHLTSAAQSALRRTMEVHAPNTRFCLICNFVSKITDPVASRCAKFRFRPLADDTVRDTLMKVADAEGVTLSDAVCRRVIDVSRGDLRAAITTLQGCFHMSDDGVVSPEAVEEVSGTLPSGATKSLWAAVTSGSVLLLDAAVRDLLRQGFPAADILERCHDELLGDDRWTGEQKSRMCEAIAVADVRVLEGASEYLQCMHVAATCARVAAPALPPVEGAMVW